jgi:hypothetical protein
MLAELRQHHEAIGRLLSALEALCMDAQPDMAKLSVTRLELTRASRARSAYLNLVVYPYVERICTAEQRIAFEKLKSEGILMLVRAGDHVRHWTSRQIAADWRGYCSASAAARQTMWDRMKREADLIYPLLRDEDSRHQSVPTAK